MPVYQIYSSWFQRLRQLWPQECITRVRNMAWLLTGLWMAKSIHLSYIAVHLPWPIQKASIECRLSRRWRPPPLTGTMQPYAPWSGMSRWLAPTYFCMAPLTIGSTSPHPRCAGGKRGGAVRGVRRRGTRC